MKSADVAFLEAKSSFVEQKGKAMPSESGLDFEVIPYIVSFSMRYPLVTVDPKISWKKELKRIDTTTKRIDFYTLVREEVIHTIATYRYLELKDLPCEMLRAYIDTANNLDSIKEAWELGMCHMIIGCFISGPSRFMDDMDAPSTYMPWDFWKWPAIAEKLKDIPQSSPEVEKQRMLVLSGGVID